MKVGVCVLKGGDRGKDSPLFRYERKGIQCLVNRYSKDIIRQEDTGKYNEHIWYIFKTYLSSINSEFNEAIKDVKRRWIHDILDKGYSHTDLMSTASERCNNIVVNEG